MTLKGPRRLLKTFTMFALATSVLFAVDGAIGAERLIYGYGSVGEGMWPLLVAQQKGLFKKNGVPDVEMVLIEGGLRGMSALLAGDVQIMQTGGALAIQAIQKGAPLIILGVYPTIMAPMIESGLRPILALLGGGS